MELIFLGAAALLLAIALAGAVVPFWPFARRGQAAWAAVGCVLMIGSLIPGSVGRDRGLGASAGILPDRMVALDPAGMEVPSPFDPDVRHAIRVLRRREDGLLDVSTRRAAPSGTSFSRRLVQCDPLRFVHLYEGETPNGLARGAGTDFSGAEFSGMAPGSIADIIARQACAAAGMPVHAQPVSVAEIRARKQVIRAAVDGLRWREARLELLTLTTAGLATEAFKSEVEARMLALLRFLPADAWLANLQGYAVLESLGLETPVYAQEVEWYRTAIETAGAEAMTRLHVREWWLEGLTRYQHPDLPADLKDRSTAYLILERKDLRGPGRLHLGLQYVAPDRLFVRRVIAWYDGVETELVSGRFAHQGPREWIEIAPDDRQIAALRGLVQAAEVRLRFEGARSREEIVLSARDKRALEDILHVYDALESAM